MSKKRDQIRLEGGGLVTRRCGERLAQGTLAPMKEGQPLPEGAEFVYVKAPDEEGWRDVEVLYRHEGSGPAQVATPEYREGYDRIFGKNPTVGQA